MFEFVTEINLESLIMGTIDIKYQKNDLMLLIFNNTKFLV